MSNLERHPQETLCGGTATLAPVRELLPAREVPLGGPRAMLVRRTLPHRDRRTVGAWCFVDHYGPHDVGGGPGMQVPPHPHTGLQTVSWLVDGEVLHRDSLGNTQLIRPGELNLMTAGHAIAHSEESPPGHGPVLHGVQLWVALPEGARHQPAHFEHHGGLPVILVGDARVTVIAGELAGAASPAVTYTPLVGAEATLRAGGRATLPLQPDFEHAVLTLSGDVSVDGEPLPVGTMLYLGLDRGSLDLAAGTAARLLLLGGEPFEEELVMWWNFVGRSHDEVARARSEWEAGERFGSVHGYAGDRLPAPPLPAVQLRPRGRQRP